MPLDRLWALSSSNGQARSHKLRLVLKFGSGILSNPAGNTLDRRQFARLGREVAELMEAGHECLIVSSAAVAAGLAALGWQIYSG